MKITPYNTPLAPPLRPHFANALGIHRKLHVMPTGHGMPKTARFQKWNTRRVELKDMLCKKLHGAYSEKW